MQMRLDIGDALELAEMLQFLHDWLGSDAAGLDWSLARFVGGVGYGVDELRQDLARFIFLLGADDGELLFGGDQA